MRSLVGRELRKQFEGKLKERYPCFERVPATLPGGSRLYGCYVAEGLSVYVLLQIPESGERFNLSIGYGDKVPLPTHPSNYDDAICRSGLFRIGRIVYRPYRDHWWNVDPLASSPDGLLIGRQLPSEEECVARLPNLIAEAFDVVRQHAIPFFEDVARRHGIESAPF